MLHEFLATLCSVAILYSMDFQPFADLHANKDVSAGRPDPELHEYIVQCLQCGNVKDSDKRRRLFSGKRDRCLRKH